MATYPIVRMNLNNTSIEFRDVDIIEASVLQEIHPISLELPACTAEICVFTTDPRFNIFSDGEFYSALSRNIPVDLYEYFDGEEVLIGKFYLDQWSAPTENQIVFEIVDAIGIYANLNYSGGFWEQPTPVGDVIGDVLNTAGIPYDITPNVAQRLVNGWIAPGTVREALQQVCFAGLCRVLTAKLDMVHITDAVLPVTSARIPYGYYGACIYGDGIFYNQIALQEDITDVDKAGKQKLTHLPMVTQISLSSHDYYHPLEGEQTAEEIFNAWLEPGDYEIPYPKPYWKVWAEGVGAIPIVTATEDEKVIVTEGSGSTWQTAVIASESEVFTFYSNHVSLHVVTAGQIKVMGYPWIDNMQTFRYDEAESAELLIQGFYYSEKLYGEARYSKITILIATPNMLSVEGATLVNATRAPAILDKLVKFYGLRYQQEVKLFPTLEKSPGDIQMVDSLYQKDIVGITTKLTSDLTGGFLIDAEIIGLERIDSNDRSNCYKSKQFKRNI